MLTTSPGARLNQGTAVSVVYVLPGPTLYVCDPETAVSATLTQLVAVGATGGGHAPATPDELLDEELELDVEVPDELLDELLVEDAPLDEELLLEELLEEELLEEELLEEELLGAMSPEDDPPPPQAVNSTAAMIGATRTKARPRDAASMDFRSFDMATLAE